MTPNMLCDSSKLLIDALEIMKSNGKGAVFIVNKQQKVVGVIADGDVRTALLSGAHLQDSVKKVMNKKFVFALDTESTESILKKINAKIKILPIVTSEGLYVSFFEFSQNVFLPVASPDLSGNELKYLTEAFLSTWISSSGKYIEQFEHDYAKFCGTKYAVAVSNGTTALHVALEALGIGAGDEVIVPDLTFAATINCVLHANATPVIVDIKADDWGIDPIQIEKAITKRTKAIIPVHLYGQPCQMDKVIQIAKKYRLKVIEDAAEAHGAEFGRKKVGAIGDVGCFSFYGNKVLTTGEGGMCVTNSKRVADAIRTLRDHGMSKKKRYWHDVVGYNYRMTNLQAAIGLAQLERISEILQRREAVEFAYRSELGKYTSIQFQNSPLPKRKKITWLVSCLMKPSIRAQFMKKLKAKGIDSRPFFYPLSTMPLYKKYVHSAKLSKRISKQGINFPTSSEVNTEALHTISQILRQLEVQ